MRENGRVTGRKLNEELGLGLKHALYREDGKWYHHLAEFPGALFDSKGFIVFHSREEYERNSYLQHGDDLHVPLGISAMPNYITFDEFTLSPSILTELEGSREENTAAHSYDFDEIGEDGFSEGAKLIRVHEIRERNQTLVKLKKQMALNKSGRLICEVCDFDFLRVYGELGRGFAECHHTKPVSELNDGDKTRLVDLAIVCANCHRMLHRKKPMVTMAQLRQIVYDGICVTEKRQQK